MLRPLVSVVIPAFNEWKALPAALSDMAPVLESVACGNWEVIISDDGSTDRMAEFLARPGTDPRIRVVRSGANRGKGAALRAGTKASQGEFVLFCDADLPVPPGAIVPFIDAVKNGAHIAIGNRRSPGTSIARKQPAWRRVLGNAYAWLSAAVTDIPIEDFNCGFKLFRGDVARELMCTTRVEGWAIDTELLAVASRRGYVIAELPVIWRHGEKSSIRPLRAIIRTLWELVNIWVRLRKEEPPRS